MSIQGLLAALNDERPRAWLQYEDGSWAPVAEDGWIGPSITVEYSTQQEGRTLGSWKDGE
ncbi:hypothetical protein ACFXHA_16695 [Nocardia sp. NPDC059240]|uniref:hypothetical protein n=1 Tax=Nocardia sp. NPDC059240 TaxID=3346786 RepID=UPI0036C5D5DA